MDERRRFDRHRPSDAEITRSHNALVNPIPEPALPEPIPVDVEDAAEKGDTAASVDDRRQRALAALRRAVAAAGRGRNRTRQARTVPSPAARAPNAEAHHEPAQVARDQTMNTFGTEEFRGLAELSGHADPHWSERPNRGHRVADPGRTDQP